jgi:alkylation response protein AidB-like acyl-CoA dehydrogenase
MEGSDVALKAVGYVQTGLGRMFLERAACERLLENTCQQLIEGRDAGMSTYQRVGWMDVVKVKVTEAAIEATDQGMRLVGGSTFRRGNLLERLYRDARSGPFHPLTTDQTYDLLGRFELGLMDEPAEESAAAAEKQPVAA